MIIAFSRVLGDSVYYVGSSAILSFSDNTNASQTIPACNVGDMLISIVMHRDTITTVPTGWTLIGSAAASWSGSPSQKVSAYYRIAQSGDSGALKTWIQATSQPIAVQIFAFRANSGLPKIVDHDVSTADNSGGASFSAAVSTATADGQIAVSFATYALASGTPTMTMTGGTQTTPGSMTNERLCGGYLVLPVTGNDTSGIGFSTTSAAAGGGWAGISLVIGNSSWTDTASITTSFEGSDYNGFTLRQVYSGSMLSTSGSFVRLQLKAGSSGGFTLDGLYIGEQASAGDAYDMKSSSPAPAQCLVGGSGTITVAANGLVFTDTLPFAIDETKTYVISAHFSASSTLAVANGTSVAGYTKAAVSEAATADVTGYTARPAGQALMIAKIQVAG